MAGRILGIAFLFAVTTALIFAWWPSSKQIPAETSTHSIAPEGMSGIEASNPQSEAAVSESDRQPMNQLQSEHGTSDSDVESAAQDPILDRLREIGCIDPDLMRIRQLSPTRREELNDWLESEGHFGGIQFSPRPNLAQFDDYSSYGTDGLRQLADGQGDRKAQMALATRLMVEGEHEEAEHWFREAAVNGYTVPISILGALHSFSRVRELPSSAGEEEAREAMRQGKLDALPYYEFAAMRGAPGAESMLHIMKERGDTHPVNLESGGFSDEEWASAREQAIELYEDFETERQERGLPPFDNSQPAIADVFKADLLTGYTAAREGLRPCNMPTRVPSSQ